MSNTYKLFVDTFALMKGMHVHDIGLTWDMYLQHLALVKQWLRQEQVEACWILSHLLLVKSIHLTVDGSKELN